MAEIEHWGDRVQVAERGYNVELGEAKGAEVIKMVEGRLTSVIYVMAYS